MILKNTINHLYIYKKKAKSVKRSNIKTIRQTEKVDSNSSLYSDTKKVKYFER